MAKKIDLTWHHVFNAQIRNGLIKEIGVIEYCVLSVIKSYTDINNGSTIGPTRKKIADLIGYSEATVKRALSNLYKMKKIERTQLGRTFVYKVIEKLPFTSLSGDTGQATFPYVPKEISKITKELQLYVKDGVEPQSININFYFNQINQQQNINLNLNEIEFPDGPLGKKLRGIVESIRINGDSDDI